MDATRIFGGFDPAEVLLLAECSNYAYETSSDVAQCSFRDNCPTCPEGYTFIGWLWGRNPDFLDWGDNEEYVAIYRKDNSNDYIFAFKGTASIKDLIQDFKFWENKPLPYYSRNKMNLPEIAQGFFQIYTRATTCGKSSLQQQLFEFIITNSIQKLSISGHSLGAALAEIFTLDLCQSIVQGIIPKIELTHYNFACPAVGVQSFADAYNHFCKHSTLVNTIRFVNYWDLIPCFTQDLDKKYIHATDYYLFSFYWDDFSPWSPCNPYPDKDLIDLDKVYVQHSMINYRNVLKVIDLMNPQKGQTHGVDIFKIRIILNYDAAENKKECICNNNEIEYFFNR